MTEKNSDGVEVLKENMKTLVDSMLWQTQLDGVELDPKELAINKVDFSTTLIHQIFDTASVIMKSHEIDEALSSSALVLTIKMRKAIAENILVQSTDPILILDSYRRFFSAMVEDLSIDRSEHEDLSNTNNYLKETNDIFKSLIEFIDYK